MDTADGPTDGPATGNDDLYHNAALGVSIICPLLALLPPRRVNLSTAGLGASWLLAANYLVQERRNKMTILKPGTNDRTGMTSGIALPSGASAGVAADSNASAPSQVDALTNSTSQTVQAGKSRAEEYQDKLDEGASYGDIIKEQIWSVWNQDKGQKD